MIGVIVVGHCEDRRRSDLILESIEGVILWLLPRPCSLAGEVAEGFCDLGIVLNEPAIKIAETQEALNFLLGFWGGPFRNSLDLDGVHLNLSFRDNDTEVFDSSLFKVAFVGFQIEIIILEYLKHARDESSMGVEIFGEDEYIIDVDRYGAFVDEFFE